MIAIPSLELRRGPAAVRPSQQARELVGLGAGWLHVTDVEAALGGHAQWAQMGGVLAAGAQVQFGGGVRSLTQIQQLLDLGVERVAVGTQAIRHPAWLGEAARLFAGRILWALDLRGPGLVVAGRKDEAGVALDSAALADGMGLAGILASPLDPRAWDGLGAIRMTAAATPLFVGNVATLAEAEAAEAQGAVAAILAPDAGPALVQEAIERWATPPPPLRVVRGREDAEGLDGRVEEEEEGEEE